MCDAYIYKYIITLLQVIMIKSIIVMTKLIALSTTPTKSRPQQPRDDFGSNFGFDTVTSKIACNFFFYYVQVLKVVIYLDIYI